MPMLRICIVALGLCGLVGSALAEETIETTQRAEPSPPFPAAATGQFSSLLSSAILPERALAAGSGGYDTARAGGLFDSAAEVRVWGPIALRAGVTYSNDTRRMRPSVGARAQILRQAAHGIDGSLSSCFKTEGFDETEGEIESTLAIGRRFDRLYLLGNLAYGQDPEGNERDGELRASVLRGYGRATLGAEIRGRSAIGAQHGSHSAVEPRFDAVGGPIAMFAVSSFVLFAEVGPSVFQLSGSDRRWGIASLGGVGSVF